MRGRTIAWILAWTACDGGPAPRPAPAPAAASAPAAPLAPPPVLEPAPSAAAPPGAGPSEAEVGSPRERAVLDLLSDGRTAAALELRSADPGRAFDPELAEAMTPKRYTRGVPEVLQRPAKLDGPLDGSIVRRIVRAHLNEIRSCYNNALALDPYTEGRMEIRFEVLADGTVGASAVHASTVTDPKVAECAAVAVRRWTFPKSARATKVLYPFELKAR